MRIHLSVISAILLCFSASVGFADTHRSRELIPTWKMNVMTSIKAVALALVEIAFFCQPIFAKEHWPGNYLKWPEPIVGHPDPCPTCFYLQVYISAGVQPYESGHMLMVNFYGGYFFKTCRSLAAFVNHGVLQDDVIPIAPGHVMIALRELPYTAGVAHDEIHGDGFVFMAPDYHPVAPFKNYPPVGFIRKSSNRPYSLHVARMASGSQPNVPRAAPPHDFQSHVDCN